jgi:hypothetical protein
MIPQVVSRMNPVGRFPAVSCHYWPVVARRLVRTTDGSIRVVHPLLARGSPPPRWSAPRETLPLRRESREPEATPDGQAVPDDGEAECHNNSTPFPRSIEGASASLPTILQTVNSCYLMILKGHFFPGDILYFWRARRTPFHASGDRCVVPLRFRGGPVRSTVPVAPSVSSAQVVSARVSRLDRACVAFRQVIGVRSTDATSLSRSVEQTPIMRTLVTPDGHGASADRPAYSHWPSCSHALPCVADRVRRRVPSCA